MRAHRRPVPFGLLLACCLLGACSDDTWRERDVKGLIRCIQLGDESCIAHLTCASAPDAFSVTDLLDAAEELRNTDYERLRLVDKARLDRGTQYTYELDNKRLLVRFCPPDLEGSIATMVIESRPAGREGGR
jgi:hypothetical protein